MFQVPTVLFVCTANLYRSRVAEALFNHHAQARSLGWCAFSRGLDPRMTEMDGLAPHAETALRDLQTERHHTAATKTPLTAEDLATRGGLVIATGGGMLIRAAARDALASTGRIFCLTAEPATIVARVVADGVDERPLLTGVDPERRDQEPQHDEPPHRVSQLRGTPGEQGGRTENQEEEERALPDLLQQRVQQITHCSSSSRSRL